jgi:hypothetical protein
MRLSMFLSKHSADAANIQKSNSVNHFNLCATIWKVRIFEGTPAIRNSGKKKAPLIKNDGRQVKTTCINLIHNLA